MKKLLLIAALILPAMAQALPITYGAENCGTDPLPGVNSQDLRIECLGYTPFNPADPTRSGIASIIRTNSPIPSQTQNDIAVVGWAQSNATGINAAGNTNDSTYTIGVQGISDGNGYNLGVRGGKFEANLTSPGVKNDGIAMQALASGSKSNDPSQPHRLVIIQAKARGNLPNPQPINAAIEVVAEPGAIIENGIELNGTGIVWDSTKLRRRVYIKGSGVCDQFRVNTSAPWQ